jgi:hypothetical protein
MGSACATCYGDVKERSDKDEFNTNEGKVSNAITHCNRVKSQRMLRETKLISIETMFTTRILTRGTLIRSSRCKRGGEELGRGGKLSSILKDRMRTA